MLDASFTVYNNLAKLTPNDPWMWHNMSLLHLRKGKLVQAWKCNKKALEIMPFENAFNIQRLMRKGLAILVALIILVILFLVLAITLKP